jgi:hypothetical protein
VDETTITLYSPERAGDLSALLDAIAAILARLAREQAERDMLQSTQAPNPPKLQVRGEG